MSGDCVDKVGKTMMEGIYRTQGSRVCDLDHTQGVPHQDWLCTETYVQAICHQRFGPQSNGVSLQESPCKTILISGESKRDPRNAKNESILTSRSPE